MDTIEQLKAAAQQREMERDEAERASRSEEHQKAHADEIFLDALANWVRATVRHQEEPTR